MAENNGMRKIREGLKVLIEGMIEDTQGLAVTMGRTPEAQILFDHRVEKVEEYLKDAETYDLPQYDKRELRAKYVTLRREAEKIKLRIK
ncbi:MAG: hypothetical protein KJ879_01800 [Nanoarchaeota archaeon]|nr:hypothetical protein [Nanoarchaeota archaeon]